MTQRAWLRLDGRSLESFQQARQPLVSPPAEQQADEGPHPACSSLMCAPLSVSVGAAPSLEQTNATLVQMKYICSLTCMCFMYNLLITLYSLLHIYFTLHFIRTRKFTVNSDDNFLHVIY